MISRLWSWAVPVWISAVPYLVILAGVSLAVLCLFGLVGCRKLDLPSL